MTTTSTPNLDAHDVLDAHDARPVAQNQRRARPAPAPVVATRATASTVAIDDPASRTPARGVARRRAVTLRLSHALYERIARTDVPL